ncbi:MAG: hypothetical protein NC039_06925 [Muribaculaceae bacterium]|nr:hypothetical protein [Muribaculaceae bacterium]
MRKILTAIAVTLALASCSGNGNSVFKTSRDKEAYALGQAHAKEVIAIADDEAALQDKLLEIRARISNIDSKLGAQSATDYEAGFTDGIKAGSDSLARILF